ncbi:hypothetical protein HK405_014549 [Cladochytrium tenue]|nr:hypothetical protein HK405_014549 [Cladochytrium tenue]
MALRAPTVQQSGFGTVAPTPHRPPAAAFSLGHLAMGSGYDGSRRTAAGAGAAPASNQRREVVAPVHRLRRTLTQQGRSSFGTTSDPQAAAADYEDDYARNPSTTDYGFLPAAKVVAAADAGTGGAQPDPRFSRHTLGRQQGLSAVTEASPITTISRTSPWDSMPRPSSSGRRSSASAGTRSLVGTMERRSGGQGLEAQLVGGDVVCGSERRASLSRTQLRSSNGSVVWEQSVPTSLYPSSAPGGGGNANSLVRSHLEPIRPSPFGSAEDVVARGSESAESRESGAGPTAASPTSPVSASAASATGEKDNLVSHESVSGEARRRWSDKALEAVLSVLEWLRSVLLNPLDPEVFWIRSWLLLMDVLHIISWIAGPVFLAWSEYISPAVLVASLVRDLLLMISCYLQSRFLFKNEYGLPVHDTGEIRRHFLFTKRGFLQVFGTIPTQFIGRIVPFPSGLCSAIIPEANVDAVL